MADQEGYSSEGCGRCGDIDKLEAENERLRNFLQVALDCHDDEHGPVNASVMPNHWTVQAKRTLEQGSRDNG